MDVNRLDGMLQTSLDVSTRLDDFSERETPLSETFSRVVIDINAFTSAWGILEHTFRDPQYVLTGTLIQKLNLMVTDCDTIFTSLRSRLQSLHIQYKKLRAKVNHGIFWFTGHGSTKKQRLLHTFLDDGSIVLARAQIVFATSILNIIIAVIQHSRVGSFRRPPELREQLDACLIEEQIQSRLAVARKEQSRRTSEPAALQWMEQLPSHQREASAVFDRFAAKWVRKSAVIPYDARGHNTTTDNALENHVALLVQKLKEQEQRTQTQIGQLEGKLRVLDANLTSQREAAAATRREDQERIDILEAQILNQETQRKADQQLIAKLRDECEKWKKLASKGGFQGGDDPSSVHAVFDDVRGLQSASQELDQSTQTLRQELERWKREVRQQQRQSRALQQANTTLTQQVSDQQAAQTELQRLSKELKDITENRDAWRHQAEKLKQRIPRAPPNAYPTDAMDRHHSSRERRDSGSGQSMNRVSSGTSSKAQGSHESLRESHPDQRHESSRSRSRSRDYQQQPRQDEESYYRHSGSSQAREQDGGRVESDRTRRRRRRIITSSPPR